MANEYLQTDIVGTSYIRSNLIEIKYPEGEIPSTIMHREKIYNSYKKKALGFSLGMNFSVNNYIT